MKMSIGVSIDADRDTIKTGIRSRKVISRQAILLFPEQQKPIMNAFYEHHKAMVYLCNSREIWCW
jgi:hypothetical protein